MAAKTTALTDTQIKKTKSVSNKTIKLADGDGLQLLIKPSGSKIWHLRYTNPITKSKTTISFGSYPSITLAKARTLRKEARELLSQNIDPKKNREDIEQKKRFAHSNSFRAVFDEWFAIKETNVTTKQSKLIKRGFENHLFKLLGSVPIGELKPQQVIEVVRHVEKQGKHDLAKRLCARINEVMTYAANTGRINSNPLTGITSAFKKVKATPNPAIKPERLPWLLKIINAAELKRVTRCLIEWQLHTMVRPNEAVNAKWQEIDLEKQLWIIPIETMKMDKPHIVPLTPQTLSLLSILKPMTGDNEFLFPSFRSNSKDGHINSETVNKAFRRMNLGGIQTAHGLRSVASTTLNEQGFDYDVIESALAHLDDNQVRRSYNRTDYMERRKKLMTWWSNHIEQCATGNFSLSGTKHLKVV